MARIIALVVIYTIASSCSAFISPIRYTNPVATRVVGDTPSYRQDVSMSMGFFDFLKKNKDSDADDSEKPTTNASADSAETTDEAGGSSAHKNSEEATPVVDDQKPLVIEEKPKVELSPLEKAKELRSQAARIRLEADKRQVELTLEKIEKLTTKLEVMKLKDTIDAKEQLSVEEELGRLKSQLFTDENGEIKPVAVPVAAKVKSVAAASASSDSSTVDTSSSLSPSRPTLSAEEMEQRVKRFQDAPEFMKVLVAKTVGFGVDDDTPGAVDRLNATDIILKLHADGIDYNSIAVTSLDFANEGEQENARNLIEKAYKMSKDMKDDYSSDNPPVFTEEQISAKQKELEDASPKFIRDILASNFGNNTELAIMMLEDEWKEEKRKKSSKNPFNFWDRGEIGRDGERMDLGGDRGAFSRLFSDTNNETGALSDTDFMMNSLYPDSTRKEDATPDKRQVNAFLNDVVATTKAFTPSADALPVAGGWIIRGTNECKSGEELIEKLDRRIANDSRLRDKISFYILKDPFPNPEETMFDPLNWPSVLFVAGPDVAREPAVILRTIISSIGIATAWYGSIYPFLANSKLLDRATEAMELSDTGMPVDLSWLSDMSIPLFISFMGIQILHEIAHLGIAKSRGFEVAIPTLVPSIMTGVTNAITSLKSSPNNKKDLVDFAVAGPLVGMLASILLLSYGLVLTSSADPATIATYPGLPLAVLRTSSLGGGLIDIFLGNGVLNVPASAEGAQALASTLIALHPFAVAGFFSLFVNALALVPAGRTDGGRISMALFGRSGSQAVTFGALASLFILGITQSDLLLFYFTFIVFFQSELEIPMRNEVDDVPVPSVAVASFAGFLMLLTLIPMA